MANLTVSPDLTPAEQSIIDTLLTSHAQVSEVLPEEIEEDQLWGTLTACCKSLTVQRRNISLLKPMIGRALILIQNRPNVYLNRGYRNFEHFMAEGVYDIMGVPRSEAYAAKRLVEQWPSLTCDDLKAVTYSKLTEISKAGIRESSPEANRFLAAAQEKTLDKLKDWIAEEKGIPKGDMQLCSVSVIISKTERSFWESICQNPKVRSIVGSDIPGRIFSAALDVAYAEWTTQEDADVVDVTGMEEA